MWKCSPWATDRNRWTIAKAALEHARNNQQNLVIIDTAGRLHIDEDMMRELQEIKEQVEVDATILTVDAMTGQDAVNVATTFAEKVGIDGRNPHEDGRRPPWRCCSFH